MMESYYDGISPEIQNMSLEEIEARIAEIKKEEAEAKDSTDS